MAVHFGRKVCLHVALATQNKDRDYHKNVAKKFAGIFIVYLKSFYYFLPISMLKIVSISSIFSV